MPPIDFQNWLHDFELVKLYQFMADNHHDPAWRDRFDMARFALGSACRVSEMLRLYLSYEHAEPNIPRHNERFESYGWCQIVPSKREVFIHLKNCKTTTRNAPGKKRHSRTIALTPESEPFFLARHARMLKEDQSILFPNPQSGNAYSRRMIAYWWEGLLDAAGIERRPCDSRMGRGKPLSIHKARHTAVSQEVAWGRLTLQQAMLWAGHVDIKTAAMYQHCYAESLFKPRDAVPEWRAVALAPITERKLKVVVV